MLISSLKVSKRSINQKPIQNPENALELAAARKPFDVRSDYVWSSVGPSSSDLPASTPSSDSVAKPLALSFKAALSGSPMASHTRIPQWTFVGDQDLEPSSFQGEPALRVSPALKERLCQPWKRTLIVRLLGRSVSYNYICSQL
ncbi:unnamed protein product [Linum trigynum]|uniref:Uncharacterized protein n=1 Tax=Linum trigynum TaxID=586398 RepID=A0AAV2FFF3_9ROSI